MKKIFILSLLLFQVNDLVSQEFKISVTAESKNDYKIIGNDSTGDINTFDPDLIFNLGSKLIFEVSSPGHPFLIKSEPGIGKKNSVKEIEKNGLSKGIIEWEPKQKGTYYYQCIKHKNMVGKIIIQ
jgi:plastocyanin|tara:strand:- start:498 stop:875 length:378 start_codon:yes stop_codon:yes gene_type:complete